MATTPIPDIADERAPDLPTDRQEASPTGIRFPQREFALHDAHFGDQTDEAIEKWLYESLRIYKDKHKRRFETLLPRWDRIYSGTPLEEEKSFPWAKCSNLIIQVVGQEVDDLCARVVELLFKTSPLAIFRYVAKSNDPGRSAEKARLLEQFFDLCGWEPDELDLYPKESRWFADAAKYGCGFVKCVPETRMEGTIIGYDEQKKKTHMEESELYRGPKVVNLRLDAVMMDPEADTIEESDLVTCKSTLTRKRMEERIAAGFYTEEAWSQIEGHPDRHGVDAVREKELRAKGIQPTSQDEPLAEWDIEECHFAWLGPGAGKEKVKYRLIEWYHYETKTCLRRVFNFMPGNACPILRTRLSTSDKGAYGRGYCEMLEDAQNEVSGTHNRIADAATAGILGINRIDPAAGANLDRNIQIYPFAVIPMRKDAFENIPLGNPLMVNIAAQAEAATLQLTHERSGVGPATAGMGAGSMQGRGRNAQFGSMGTLAVLQDSNTRVSHRTSDFRHSHVRLASLLIKMYNSFGMGRPGSMFGLDDELLVEALEDFSAGRIKIPVRAATASANREVSKQNMLLLNQTLANHDKEMIQMLQAEGNPQIPPEAKQFFIDSRKGRTRLMKQIFRAFDLDQPSEFVPDGPGAEAQPQNPMQGMPNANTPGAATGGPMADPRAALLQSLLARGGGGMAGPGGGAAQPAATSNGSPFGAGPAGEGL